MLGLILKDFYNNRKMLIIKFFMAIVPGLFFLLKLNESSKEDNIITVLYILAQIAIISFIFVMCSDITHSFMKTDEHTTWINFAVSTPYGKKYQILEKYIVNLIVLVITSAYTYGLLALSGAINGVHAPHIAITFLFLFFMFQSSIDLLMDFVSGTKYGNYVKMIMAFSIISGFIIYGLYGKIPESFSFDSVMEFMMKLFNNGMKGSALYKARYGIAGISGLYVLSYFITVKLYKPDKTLLKQ